jgi:two-component system response regulator FixJ
MEKYVTYVLDDEPDMVELVSSYLRAQGHIVRSFTDSNRFLNDFSGHEARCLVLDLQMPELHGLEVLDQIKAWLPVMPVIFISAHADVPMAVRMMKQGAFDLLQKPFTHEEFLACLDRAMIWSADIHARYQDARKVWCGLQSLTPRETEILDFLLVGLTSREISERLSISRFTVDHHREHIMSKLQSPSLSGLTSSVAQAKAVFDSDAYRLKFSPRVV